jgi:hypothetical protein
MGHRKFKSLTGCALSCGAVLLLTASGALAQDQQPTPAPQDQTPHPWRSAADVAPPAPADQAAPNPAPAPPPNYSSYPSFPNAPQQAQLPNPNAPLPGAAGTPNYTPQQGYPQQPAYQGQQGYPPQPGYPRQPGYQGQAGYQGQQQPNNQQAPPPIPAHLTIAPGTFISVRISQPLSSDKNQQGDTFFATLAEPIIVNGVVVAQRGETVSGRVTEAQKAGRVTGTSRLGVELTGITLVDGQQLSIQSQMVTRNGNTSVGRDAAAIGGTTALGAAVGAAADWGRGAAIGAGAGAAVGILGVLLTRGQPTIIYPETPLTFRISAPVEIATDHAPQAFHYAQNRDYGPSYSQRPPTSGYGYAGAPGPVAPVPYYGPAYYPYPYYWGPGLSVYVGPGFYGGYRYRGFWR